MERPNKTREEEYRKLLPAEKALVKMPALMMCGRTLILARLMAMTYGLGGEGGLDLILERKFEEKSTFERRYRFRATSQGHRMVRAYQ